MAAKRQQYPGTVRINGGRWRGRKLPVPESEGLRPTPNRVRETVFNWLRPYLPGARCLDVTAGTGSLCLEALSQGAGEVVMVEMSPLAVKALRQNLRTLDAESQATLIQGDGLNFLKGPVTPFDIIFLDPPFRSDLIAQCSAEMEQRGWIRPGGLIYIEAPSDMDPLPIPENWTLIRSKSAGQVGYHLAQTEME
ncbi:MAG: 16S rRNA (guanine(966)-N(2))-methyltransferase RsmD [Proteobacteria bacterium]|nr:16S rRNA (guanine(966)-N(2))-methyltransferase RsmD [Pseudomonadota bacterium]